MKIFRKEMKKTNLESKLKRICMITMSSYPEDTRILRQAVALESAGYEVDILCGSHQIQSRFEKFGNVSAYRIMNIPHKEHPVAYVLQSLLFIVVAFFRLQLLAVKRKYLILQTHNLPDYLIFSSIIQKLFGAKLILDIHDPSVELYRAKWPGQKDNAAIKAVKFVEKLSCNLADQLITVTNECKNRLVSRKNCDEKISIIMNTADERIFKFNNERKFRKISENVKILYHGTVAERFGLHNAIKAIEYILKEIPGSVFNIYGKYESSYRNKIEKLISNLKLENNVILHNRISIETVPELTNNHDIGIVPYLSTDFMNLALPTKAFEYIATGIPVVSTRLIEISNIFDEKCITYFDNSNPEKIAEAVKKLCLNPEEAKQQVNLAYKQLKGISGKVMMDRYVSLINELTVA